MNLSSPQRLPLAPGLAACLTAILVWSPAAFAQRGQNIWDQPAVQAANLRPVPVNHLTWQSRPATPNGPVLASIPRSAPLPPAATPNFDQTSAFPSQTLIKTWTAPAPGPIPQPVPQIAPAPTPPAVAPAPPLPPGSLASARALLSASEALARRPLVYKFGSNDPDSGSLDCSGTVQVLLKQIGYHSVPRTAYDQYRWVEESRLLHKVRRQTPESKIYSDLRPGQLLFWRGTYNTSKPVSHVMIYLGRDRNGRHYMFGARGTSKQGLHGNGVDVFTFEIGSNNKKTALVGYGDIPKLAYVY